MVLMSCYKSLFKNFIFCLSLMLIYHSRKFFNIIKKSFCYKPKHRFINQNDFNLLTISNFR